jgi:hypothetical protein
MRNPIRNSAHSQTEQVEQVQGPVQQAAGLESLPTWPDLRNHELCLGRVRPWANGGHRHGAKQQLNKNNMK